MDPSALDGLISQLDSHVRDKLHDATDLGAKCGTKIKHTGASFKQVRYPTKEEKNAAWGRFQGIVESVKETQAEKRGMGTQAEGSAQLRNQASMADQLMHSKAASLK